jgi:hypothetical protein
MLRPRRPTRPVGKRGAAECQNAEREERDHKPNSNHGNVLERLAMINKRSISVMWDSHASTIRGRVPRARLLRCYALVRSHNAN